MEQDESVTTIEKGMVIWLTGLPAAGKTTLAQSLAERLRREGRPVVMLDGDVMRKGISSDLGFRPEDRHENIRRAAEVAALIAGEGITVIAAFISPYRADRRRARAIIGERRFIEVYVKASLEECIRRDPKGLYRLARAGKIEDLTGLGAPYEEPQNPDIVVDTTRLSKSEAVQRIYQRIRNLWTRQPHDLPGWEQIP